MRLFGREPVEDGEIETIESILKVTLPRQLKEVSTVYKGGIVGGISHLDISARANDYTIVGRTLQLRQASNLPDEFIWLADLDESVIVLHTKPDADEPAPVIWCDDLNADAFFVGEIPEEIVQVFRDYGEFLIKQPLFCKFGGSQQQVQLLPSAINVVYQ